MKNLILFATSLFSVAALAAPMAQTLPSIEASRPNDMSVQCGQQILAALNADKSEVAQYLAQKPYSVSFDWWDTDRKQATFTIQFDEDVRKGYVAGNIDIVLKNDNTCAAGAISNVQDGD